MFGQVVGVLQVENHRLVHFVVADQNEVVELLGKNIQRRLIAAASCETFCMATHRSLHDLALFPREVNGWSLFGLHANHLDFRIDALRDDARSAGAAAAADRDNYHVNVGQVFQDFQCVCAHACDQLRLVNRINVSVAFFFGENLIFTLLFLDI